MPITQHKHHPSMHKKLRWPHAIYTSSEIQHAKRPIIRYFAGPPLPLYPIRFCVRKLFANLITRVYIHRRPERQSDTLPPCRQSPSAANFRVHLMPSVVLFHPFTLPIVVGSIPPGLPNLPFSGLSENAVCVSLCCGVAEVWLMTSLAANTSGTRLRVMVLVLYHPP